MRGRSLASFAAKCYDVYRLISPAINPVQAVLRELRDLSTHRALRYPADEIKMWLLQSYVKQVAYYAIELYSGALTLSDRPTAEYITRYSRKDLERRANAFAAMFLIPATIVDRVVADSPDPINDLAGVTTFASRLRVSRRAAIDHLYNLTIMSDSVRDKLLREVSD